MPNKKNLSDVFFKKPTVEVARNLLGKYLVRRVNGRELTVIITEVEAYDGSKDKASHASRGKTKRNEPMFGPAGYWYVYLCYGVHWMLNIVTGPKEYPAAILIRGAVTSDVRGTVDVAKLVHLDGPGKLTKFLKINQQFNGKQANKKTGLWIENRGKPFDKLRVYRGPRIGVDYAGPVWAKAHYRFWIEPH